MSAPVDERGPFEVRRHESVDRVRLRQLAVHADHRRLDNQVREAQVRDLLVDAGGGTGRPQKSKILG